MSKKLTTTELNKLNKELNQTETVKILDGKYEVNIHKVFKNSDIEDLLLTYMNVLQELNKTPDANLKNTMSLYITLLLRQFTDLPITESNDINELIKVTKALNNIGITGEVVEAMPKEQLAYLGQRASEVTKGLEDIIQKSNGN